MMMTCKKLSFVNISSGPFGLLIFLFTLFFVLLLGEQRSVIVGVSLIISPIADRCDGILDGSNLLLFLKSHHKLGDFLRQTLLRLDLLSETTQLAFEQHILVDYITRVMHHTRTARRVKARILWVEEALAAVIAHNRRQFLFAMSERAIRLAASGIIRAQASLDDTFGSRRFGGGELGSATKHLLLCDVFTRMEKSARATRAVKLGIATVKTATVAVRAHTRAQLLG